MTARVRSIAARTALIVGLVAASFGLGELRRVFIGRIFIDGAVPEDLPIWTATLVGDGLKPAEHVRVILLDGLSSAVAGALPSLSGICASGQDLRVDVGFPTVSLPVQHALWTGLTQQQSGLQYRIARLAAPPRGALPPQVDSVAVAESHPEIVHSFGFRGASPPPDAPVTDAWRETQFADAALAAVRSDARLAFIHVLRIDEAGHAHGAAGPEYAAAAAWSDKLLATLFAARPADERTAWVILSDHGHRDLGGHGGAEPSIRLVRACVAGGKVQPAKQRMIHLIDLSRALADLLDARLHPDAVGRPWQAALADPARGATLPRPGPTRWLIAGVIALAGGLSLRTGPGQHVPWSIRFRWLGGVLAGPRWLGPALGLGWLTIAALGVAIHCGWPTLSNPAVYPPLGRDLLQGSVPGLLLLIVLTTLAMKRWDSGGVTVVRTVLLPWAAATATALLMCRAPDALLFGGPPLMPWSTGLASMLLVQGRAVCLLLALMLVVRAALRWLVHRRRSRTPAAPAAPADPA
jgi:hypothetical protein